VTERLRALRDALPSRPVILLVGAAASLVILVALAAGPVLDVAFSDLADDPMSITGGHPLTGALSHLGVLVWWTGATAALFGGGILWRMGREGTASRFLLGAGLITVYLAIDDLFMLHEGLLREYTPLPQPVILGLMVLVIGLFLGLSRTFIRTTHWALLIFAGVLMFGSLGIDFISDFGESTGRWSTPEFAGVLEESLKWLAIVAWTSYLVDVSASAVLRVAPSKRQGEAGQAGS
jgi:hypothetical protein